MTKNALFFAGKEGTAFFGKGKKKVGAPFKGGGNGIGLVKKVEAVGREIKIAQIQMPPQAEGKVGEISAAARVLCCAALRQRGGKTLMADSAAPGKAIAGGKQRAGGKIPGIGAAERQGAGGMFPFSAIEIQAEKACITVSDAAAQGCVGAGKGGTALLCGAKFFQSPGVEILPAIGQKSTPVLSIVACQPPLGAAMGRF